MASRFIEQEEAAKILGISLERLNDLRNSNELRAFRDGGTWKFRSEDLEKAKTTLADKLRPQPQKEKPGSDVGIADAHKPEPGDSVLLSERELGGSAAGSSTIIGKNGTSAKKTADSDVKLAEESDIMLGDEVGKGSGTGSGPGSDLGLQFEELDSLELELGAGSGKAKAASEKSDIGLGSDSDLTLSTDDDLDLGSDASTLDLTGEEDDDLVLGGSGSDVTSNASDSGIQLLDPSDSGLSLDEEPIELGSSISEHLELGEEDMITLEGGDSQLSAATQLKADDDFLLTPLEGAEDESESGSQVIALDTSEGSDFSTATALGPAGMAMLEEDAADTLVAQGAGAARMPGPLPGGQPLVMAPAELPEAPYSIWNVLSLFVCLVMITMTGMMLFDLVRNIWSWDQAYPVNSSIMEAVLSMFRSS